MKEYLIKKNRHRCCWFNLSIHLFKKHITKHIYFDDTAEYNLKSNDQYDINKLFGISYGFHHKNSARIGWRWDLKENKIEILAYVYNNGKRINEWDENIHIAFIESSQENEMSITKENGHYVFKVNDKTIKIKHGRCSFWGYMLFPYFGGNRKSPHNIYITM